MRIFVTGANGCIGHVLTGRLLEAGHAVTALALDRNDTDRIEKLEGIEIEWGDIRHRQRLTEIFRSHNFEIVIHLAAMVHHPGATPTLFQEINTEATVHLFDLSRKYKVKQFVFFSTVAVYGGHCERPYNEEDTPRPNTPYGISKRKAEVYLTAHSGQGIGTTIIRPTTVYGKYDRGNINKLVRIASRRIVPLVGKGDNLKSFVFVENLVDGVMKTIGNPAAANQIFIFSDAAPYSVNEIIQQIEAVVGKKIIVLHLPAGCVRLGLNIINGFSRLLLRRPVLNASSIRKLSTDNIFDISKARNVLGYDPKYSLKEGLTLTYADPAGP